MDKVLLPKQPHPLISYLKVGKLLYYALILFILESIVYYIELEIALNNGTAFWIAFWVWSFGFSFVHIFLVLMDGWSRYQNYKRAKDQFFDFGYQPKIARLYIGSKCQRMAAIVAANELGIGDKVKNYYREKGVRWYHYIPYFMLRDPLFFFKKSFWSRTFLEPSYKSKYDFRNLKVEVAL